MMNPYVLAVPERVISGAGCISKLPELLKELEKKKVALFADMGALKSGAIDATIETLKVSCESFTLVNNVPPEPEDRQVREIFGQVKDWWRRHLPVPARKRHRTPSSSFRKRS